VYNCSPVHMYCVVSFTVLTVLRCVLNFNVYDCTPALSMYCIEYRSKIVHSLAGVFFCVHLGDSSSVQCYLRAHKYTSIIWCNELYKFNVQLFLQSAVKVILRRHE